MAVGTKGKNGLQPVKIKAPLNSTNTGLLHRDDAAAAVAPNLADNRRKRKKEESTDRRTDRRRRDPKARGKAVKENQIQPLVVVVGRDLPKNKN